LTGKGKKGSRGVTARGPGSQVEQTKKKENEFVAAPRRDSPWEHSTREKGGDKSCKLTHNAAQVERVGASGQRLSSRKEHGEEGEIQLSAFQSRKEKPIEREKKKKSKVGTHPR